MTTPTTPVWKEAANGAKAAEDLDALEELGTDAIIAQESVVHAPQRRVKIKEESQSIVISDVPPSDPRTSQRVHHAEKTLVIRDRRQVEALRRSAAKKYRQKQAPERVRSPTGFRSITVWAVAGLVAFAFGGLVALLASRDKAEQAETAKPDLSESGVASNPRSAEERPGDPSPRDRSRPILNLDKENEPVPGDVVGLEELPVEKR